MPTALRSCGACEREQKPLVFPCGVYTPLLGFSFRQLGWTKEERTLSSFILTFLKKYDIIYIVRERKVIFMKRDYALKYVSLDGREYSIGHFSTHLRSRLIAEEVERLVEEQELDAETLSVLICGMFKQFMSFEDEVSLERWTRLYVGEFRFQEII